MAPVEDHHDLIDMEETQRGEVISDFFIHAIKESLHKDDIAGVRALLAPLLPVDISVLIERLSFDDRVQLVGILKDQFDPEILSHLSAAVRSTVINQLGIETIAAILPDLDSDDAFAVIEELDENQQQRLLSYIPKENRLSFERIKSYPEDSAARLMQQEVVIAPSFWTVGAVTHYIQRTDTLPETFYEIYVVNPKHEPIGCISMNNLLRHKPHIMIEEMMERDIHIIKATVGQEEVAYLFRHYDLVAAPVVDEAGRIIGMITADDVVDVMDEEAQKEILQLAGVNQSDLSAPFLVTAYRRLAGLMVTFINSFVLASIVYHFEHLISRKVALVALMPIVAGMSGASGTQVVAVTVRGIATKLIRRQNTFQTILKEVCLGCFNGIVMAVLLMIILMLWYKDLTLGLILISALVFNMTWSALWGAVLPIFVARAGLDPAVSTGPILTAMSDVVGFLSLLTLATMFLH